MYSVSANRTAGILVRVSTTCILWHAHLSLVSKGGAPEFGILFRILFQIQLGFLVWFYSSLSGFSNDLISLRRVASGFSKSLRETP